MPNQSTSPWRPEHDRWIQDRDCSGDAATYFLFKQYFPDHQPTHGAYKSHCDRLRSTSVPKATGPDHTEAILDIRAEAVLITSDHHIPYHDADLIDKALELGRAWGCTHHILNGDVYDAGGASKFPPMVYGSRTTMSEDAKLGRAVLEEMRRGFERTTYIMGSNHEARWFARLLEAQLDTDDLARVLSVEGIGVTGMGYVVLNEDTLVTHPGAASVVPTAVGNEIASAHYKNVISGHGHSIGYRRDRGGRYTVVDTGGMFDYRRIDYLVQRHKRRPLTNQGFCIVEGDFIHLIDPRNVDWELEHAMAAAAKRRRRQRKKEKAA